MRVRPEYSAARCAAAALAATLVPSAALAQTDESLLLKPFESNQVLEAGASAIWIPRSTPGGSIGGSGMVETFSTGRFRLSTEHELNPSLGYDFSRIQVRDRQGRIPNALSDESLALATPLGQIGDWFVAVGAGAGYAGDEAFGNPSAWYAKGQFTVGRELGPDEALVFWLDYDGNRTLFPDIPLPSFGYSRKLGEQADLLIGFPTSDITWRPNDRLKIDLSWEAPVTFGAEVELKLSDSWALEATYADDERAFHITGSRDVDRLFYKEQRIEAGVQWSPIPNVKVLGAGGLAFGRSFSSGFDDRDQDRIAQVPDRPFVRAQVEIAF